MKTYFVSYAILSFVFELPNVACTEGITPYIAKSPSGALICVLACPSCVKPSSHLTQVMQYRILSRPFSLTHSCYPPNSSLQFPHASIYSNTSSNARPPTHTHPFGKCVVCCNCALTNTEAPSFHSPNGLVPEQALTYTCDRNAVRENSLWASLRCGEHIPPRVFIFGQPRGRRGTFGYYQLAAIGAGV